MIITSDQALSRTYGGRGHVFLRCGHGIMEAFIIDSILLLCISNVICHQENLLLVACAGVRVHRGICFSCFVHPENSAL